MKTRAPFRLVDSLKALSLSKGLLVLLAVAIAASGCTMMTKAQKDWVADKANRSTAYVALMDKGQTTPEQDKLWIKSQDDSWSLWKQKIDNGFAAPSFIVGE